MAIASFASKVFQVTGEHFYTIDDLQYSSALQSEKQDAEGTKPSTYNKGSDLDTMSFKLKLDHRYGCNPRNEWEDWRTIMNSGVAYPFILGGRPLGEYSWLLIGVDPSNFNIDNSGNVLAVELDLKFEEYVRPGAKKEEKSSSGKSKGLQALSDKEYETLMDV